MALFGQVVEPLQDHGSHYGSCTSLIACCRLCLSPVHYKVKRPIATMNHVTVERALQNHSHLYFTAYVVSIKYFCHRNEKPITIFPSFLGHPCDKVWTETQAEKALPPSKDDFRKHNEDTDWHMTSQLAPQAANTWPMGLGRREENQIPGSHQYYVVAWGCSRLRLKVEAGKGEILPRRERELNTFPGTQTPPY